MQDNSQRMSGESWSRPLLLGRVWGELLEHFLHALVQILDVLVGIVGECVARCASPDQLLCLGIEEIDDHRAHLVCLSGGRCLAKTSGTKTPPTPTPTKAIVESVQRLLIACDL